MKTESRGAPKSDQIYTILTPVARPDYKGATVKLLVKIKNLKNIIEVFLVVSANCGILQHLSLFISCQISKTRIIHQHSPLKKWGRALQLIRINVAFLLEKRQRAKKKYRQAQTHKRNSNGATKYCGGWGISAWAPIHQCLLPFEAQWWGVSRLIIDQFRWLYKKSPSYFSVECPKLLFLLQKVFWQMKPLSGCAPGARNWLLLSVRERDFCAKKVGAWLSRGKSSDREIDPWQSSFLLELKLLEASQKISSSLLVKIPKSQVVQTGSAEI